MSATEKCALLLVALAVRLLVAWAATGQGEMEGLASRYEQDAYAIVAGYGFIRPLETRAPEVDLIALARELGARGEKISPSNVPPITPELWRPSGLHPPAYSFYLATIYRVVGNKALFPVARALQALLDALAALVLFGAARRLASERAAKITAWAYALFLPAAYIATSRVADSFMPAWSILVFALWVRALQSGRLRDYAWTGLALGVANLFRPDFVLYPVYLGIIAIGLLRHARLRAALGSAVLGLVTLAALLPWGLRNQAVYGELKLTSNAAGMTLLQTISQFPNPYGLPVHDEDFAKLAQDAGYDGFDDPGADRMFRQRFLEIAKDDPLFLLGQVVARLPMGLAPWYRWGYTNEFYRAGHSFYDYNARYGLSAYQVLLQRPAEVLRAYWDRLLFAVVSFALLLTSIYLAWILRRRLWLVGMLFVPWIYMVSSHALIYLGARFMVPVAFCQLIALGIVIARLRGDSQPVAPWLEAPAR